MGEVIVLASFSQNIPAKYGVKSYQDTKNTYDWIMKSLNKGEFLNLKIETSFLFNISEIFCSCKNIEEFVEHAYGQSGYSFTSMHFEIESKGIPLWFISVDTISGLRISTDTKTLLEKIVNLLKSTSLDETETSDPISVMYIEHQDNSVTVNGNSNVIANNHGIITDKLELPESEGIESSGHQDNSVIIGGNRNVVASNHSIITDKQKLSESKISKWFQGVGQGIFANLLWWILGLVAVAIIAWAVSNGYISLDK